MGTEIGQLAVRRSILIDAAPERVWKEFETLERMQAWFGTGHRLLEYEPRVGGSVLLEVDIEGRPMRFGGQVTVFDPPRELTFEDDWIPSQGWAAPSLITIRLTPALGAAGARRGQLRRHRPAGGSGALLKDERASGRGGARLGSGPFGAFPSRGRRRSAGARVVGGRCGRGLAGAAPARSLRGAGGRGGGG